MPALTREQLAARRATRRQRERRRRTVLLAAALLPIAAAAALAATIASGSGGSDASPVAVSPTRAVADPIPAAGLAPEKLPEDVTVATADGVDVKLPVPRRSITAVAYHAVETPSAVPLDPQGGVDYQIAPRRGRPGSETAAVDIGAPAGTTVYSPVDGVVVSVVDPYVVLGKPAGYALLVSPSRAAGLLVRITHLDDPRADDRPPVGKALRAGRTVIGRVADLSGIAQQELAQFTNDAGNHVHVEVVRSGVDLAP
jgi:murein DD-endopeptidase MepM/ murein hydrolase activator NlpD